MRSEPRSARTPVWPLSLSLAATNKIDVSFSSSGYLDVSVHRVPLHTLWIGVWMIRVLRTGFPHSDICGSRIICISPQLFAAYHVFHRLLVPRHPPCALISLTIRLRPRVRPPSSVHSVAPLASWFFFSWFHIFRYGLGCLFSALLILIRNVSFLPICGFQGTWRSFCCRLLRTLSGTSGDGEIRTLDPLLARQVLSQLSYAPILMGLSGLEPPTSRLSGVRSNRLSYKPINLASTYLPIPLPV